MANFTQEKIDAVWGKAKQVPGQDPNVYRQDSAGAWIKKEKYGKEENLGWEVDHMFPASLGGNENTLNLQALQWENNRTKADNFPTYITSVTSNGTNYLKSDQSWKYNADFIAKLKQIYPNNPHLNKL